MSFSFDKSIRKFLLGETQLESPDVFSYIKSLESILSSLSPSTKKDAHSIAIAKQHLGQLQRCVKKLNEQVKSLEEERTKFKKYSRRK